MGRMKELAMEMNSLVSAGLDTDAETIAVLNVASQRIFEIAELLKSKKEIFDATNLPVSYAVAHVTASLSADVKFLIQLADICKESCPDLAEALKKVSGQ